MPFKDFTVNTVLPSVIGGIFGLLGSPLAAALIFGLITKIVLYIFDKEIKAIALWLRKKRDSFFKKKK